MVGLGALVNILSFSHPHVRSLLSEGLWGFPDDKLGTNQRKWDLLEVDSEVLVYGEYGGVRGVWFLCEITDKFENRDPVKYWIKNPTGYPWQIRLKPILSYEQFDLDVMGKIKPVRRDDLAPVFGVRIFRAKYDRWSLLLFGDKKASLISYNYSTFSRIKDELNVRNREVEINKPEHDKIKEIIYQIGLIQNRFPQKEYSIDGRKLDIVWRRTARSVPSVAFEVQFGGNLFEALSKLKHAFDLWNSIPVLVTTTQQIEEARRWIEGSFHELKDVFRLVSWEEIREYYDIKRKVKDFETKLKLT